MSATTVEAAPPRRTLCFTIAYDGTPYCGWQVQPNGTSLQTVFETAFEEFTGERVHAEASGRTDAGVHALAQVVTVDTRVAIPCHGFRVGLQTRLPPDVIIRHVGDATPGFNARFDAVRKTYRYVIHNAATRNPFLRNQALWHRGPLDDAAMHAALQALVGTHDFRCFESDFPNRLSSVRTILTASVTRGAGWSMWDALSGPTTADQLVPGPPPIAAALPDPRGEFLICEVTADGFLYNMVRAIVGTLIHVGRGRWNRADLERILNGGDRALAGETAPAHGLYLAGVEYEIRPERIAARLARYQEFLQQQEKELNHESLE